MVQWESVARQIKKRLRKKSPQTAKFVKEKGKKGREGEKSDVGRIPQMGVGGLLFFTTEVHLGWWLCLVVLLVVSNSKAPLERYNDVRQVRS
jgi:hypothetical protein